MTIVQSSDNNRRDIGLTSTIVVVYISLYAVFSLESSLIQEMTWRLIVTSYFLNRCWLRHAEWWAVLCQTHNYYSTGWTSAVKSQLTCSTNLPSGVSLVATIVQYYAEHPTHFFLVSPSKQMLKEPSLQFDWNIPLQSIGRAYLETITDALSYYINKRCATRVRPAVP